MVTGNRAHLLPLPGGRRLLYAPLNGIAALVDEAAADSLLGKDTTPAPAVDELRELLHTTPATLPSRMRGAPDPHFLGITTTRGCNIGCVYCNFGGPTATAGHMRPETAIAAVDWMRDRLLAANRDVFRVHFFGGEPLLAWELVELVVHRVRLLSNEHGWRNYVDASTNGVMSDERLQFVGDYFGGVVLSFDGPPEFQDRNRPTKRGGATFDAVDRAARTWADMPVDLCLRVCVTGDSVAHMDAITDWMCETYDPTVINFESLTPGDLAADAGLEVPDPLEFARGFVAASRVARRHGIRSVYSASEYATARLSFCPVGTDSAIVAPDGTVNACYLLEEDWQQRGMDMTIGQIDKQSVVTIDPDALERVRQIPGDKPRCSDCFCRWSCAGGCHVNQTYPGASDSYTDFCEQTRLITACLVLEELGHADLVDELISDEAAMRRLAHEDKWVDSGSLQQAPTHAPDPSGRLLHDSMAVLQ